MHHKSMHHKVAYRLCFLIVLGLSHPLVAQDESSAEKFNCQQLMEIVDAVLDNHISPPAKQQMILSGVRELYTSLDQVPTDLSRQVSSLASNEELIEFLKSRKKELVMENESAQRSNFIGGMLSCVPGPVSLVPAKEAKVRAQLEANRYVGIGIALTKNDGPPQITKSMYGGSGYQAGVRTNDLILEIDGKSTEGKSLNKVIEELRGDEGTVVTLVLQQPNQESRTLTVTRRVTFIPTIEGTRESEPGKWEYTLDTSPDVAMLRIHQIGPSTTHELKKIEAELRNHNLRGVALDMRSAGGTLHDLVVFADQLLDSGVLGRLRNADGEVLHTMTPGCLWKDVPIAVIVDSTTGAGPTYLAAALQDSKRATIVGEIPAGSAYTQSRVDLSDGTSLQLASGILCRANGIALVHANARQVFESTRNEANLDNSKLNYLLPDIVLTSNIGEKLSDNWLNTVVRCFANKGQVVGAK